MLTISIWANIFSFFNGLAVQIMSTLHNAHASTARSRTLFALKFEHLCENEIFSKTILSGPRGAKFMREKIVNLMTILPL